jgi:hypothetical protein
MSDQNHILSPGISIGVQSLSDSISIQQHFINRILSRGEPRVEPSRQVRPQFRSKIVCLINCKHCKTLVCRRGMKAILLADMNVELFSTDSPPQNVQLVFDDYRTRNCGCRIRDVACLGW